MRNGKLVGPSLKFLQIERGSVGYIRRSKQLAGFILLQLAANKHLELVVFHISSHLRY